VGQLEFFWGTLKKSKRGVPFDSPFTTFSVAQDDDTKANAKAEAKAEAKAKAGAKAEANARSFASLRMTA
jgi:hypothetical protein